MNKNTWMKVGQTVQKMLMVEELPDLILIFLQGDLMFDVTLHYAPRSHAF